MPSQAQDYADAHRLSRTRAHALADGLSDDAFRWRPAPGAWSVAGCLAHLNVVADAYLPVLEAAVADGAPRGAGPFEYGFFARTVRGGVVPGGPALKTGRKLDPSRGGPPAASRAETLAAFDDRVARYVAVCERADGLDLARIKVRYPFMRLLRLPLGAFLDVTGLHALRHVAQAERVASQAGFPHA